MMMPANFSAVSENEMTYVMGGSVADYLCPVMTKKEWSRSIMRCMRIFFRSTMPKALATRRMRWRRWEKCSESF